MSLGKQAVSLAIMHAADVLQPLMVLPYAAAVLGPEHFGQYAYAMSIGQLASTVTDYGFHWTAQRAAATMRDDKDAIAALYARVTLTKLCLFAFVTLLCLAGTGHVLSLSLPLLACTLLAPLGGILFPAWLMIGLECTWRAAIASVGARVLALIAFFVLVKAPDDITRAVATQAAITLVTGIFTLPFILPIGFRGFRTSSFFDVMDQLRSGWRGFLYSIVERALAVLPVPIIEHFAGYAAAGQYSLAEKFVGATRPVFRVILETFSPRIAYHAKHAPAAGVRLICRASATLLVGAGMSAALYFLGPYVIHAVFGEGFAGAIPILRVLSVMPLLLNANVVMSNFYLFNFGHERAWAGLTVFGFFVFLISAYTLSQGVLAAPLAVAAAVLARECVVLVVSTGYFVAFGLPLLMADVGADWKILARTAPRKAPRI
jgi:O-antigen/teichoic acid export membrane protein